MEFSFVLRYIIYGDGDILIAGFSSYGGLVGTVIASIIFEKILFVNGKLIKYTILSLSLVYGLIKIGYSIVGCCGRIPYEGILKIKYISALNIWQFPIQIIEVIVSLLLFSICNILKNNNNINYFVLLSVFILKFILDFFRYDYINVLFTRNQIFSIILFFITIIHILCVEETIKKLKV